MSLTSMLSGKRETDLQLQSILKEIIPRKKEFSTMSGKDAFSPQYSDLVPYQLEQSYHSSVVGTAFDYMARFIISQKIIIGKNKVNDELLAKRGLDKIVGHCDKLTKAVLEKKFKDGLKSIKQFVKGDKISFDELLPVTTYMARLEHIIRSGVLPNDIKSSLLEEDVIVITELKRMCDVFNERFMIPKVIKPDSRVIFNPHFGIASQGCGGADADVFIDGTLYDFKTTKSKGYKWQDIAQIFGYYFLNNIAHRQHDSNATLYDNEIKRLAFYKARYGEVEYFDISKMNANEIDQTTDKIYDILKPMIQFLTVRNNMK